ncbi:MAG: hypothetical protein GWN88_20895 [Nitrospinaceae bacterium]|nr:hypothetical protein [Nitrospinaceae bacterium]NIU46401.1 hypothetical protein [Nitrospinaceae bacterium]NIU98588.1 hypothetical protein [Nitrospinaceae bacterium]
MNGDEFTDHRSVADVHKRRGVLEPHDLRLAANGSAVEDPAVLTDPGSRLDAHVRADPGAGPDAHVGADEGVGIDGNIFSQLGAGMNLGVFMNRHR